MLSVCSTYATSLTGHLTAAARELARYKIRLVGVHKVRCDEGATVRAGDYTFYYGKGNENQKLGTGFFVHYRIISAALREWDLLAIGCHI